MTAEPELEMVRLVRRIAVDESRRVAQVFVDGSVEAVVGNVASVRKADPQASATPGFFVPPMLHVLPGDHVWVYDNGGYKLILAVLNRNAILPSGLTLDDLTLTGTLRRTGVLTPPPLAASNADYAPDGGTLAYRWFQSLGGGSYTTSGFLAEPDGTEHEWVNSDTAGTWTLAHLTGSAPANQLICPGYTSLALGPGASARAVYDGAAVRWRILSR